MKRRIIALWVYLLIAAAVGVQRTAGRQGLDELRTTYERALNGIAELHAREQRAASPRYDAALTVIARRSKARGDLDTYLAVEAERKRFNEEKVVPEEDGVSLPDDVVAVRHAHARAVAAADETRDKRHLQLIGRYKPHLRALMRRLTQNGKFEDAKRVKAELGRMAFVRADLESGLTASQNVTHSNIRSAARPELDERRGPSGELRRGLLLDYGFDRYDVRGKRVRDVSRNGNDAALHGPRHTRSRGQRGGGMVFDGVDDYLEAPDSVVLANDAPKSIAMWFKAESLQPWVRLFVWHKGEDIVVVALGTGGRSLGATLNGNADRGETTAVLQAGTWYHGCFVSSGRDLKIYLNGELQDAGVPVGPWIVGREGVFFGASPGNADRYFGGILDDCRVFDRGLSHGEVRQLYDEGLND